jgi:hypothetical protein
MTPADPPCSVCGEPAEEAASALCGICDRRFHLNPRNDAGGKDCGDVWIDEQYLSLRYACFNCLGLPPATGSEPPIGSAH